MILLWEWKLPLDYKVSEEIRSFQCIDKDWRPLHRSSKCARAQAEFRKLTR